ncbi:predicted protein [Aspergillus nidulans FGSC A4]|nr:predicted protein [Aspergillus nidulans FGSC A4]|eukprot:XP_868918.1 predicted protein [Aspergillus nidulans FGSC A4]
MLQTLFYYYYNYITRGMAVKPMTACFALLNRTLDLSDSAKACAVLKAVSHLQDFLATTILLSHFFFSDSFFKANKKVEMLYKVILVYPGFRSGEKLYYSIFTSI